MPAPLPDVASVPGELMLRLRSETAEGHQRTEQLLAIMEPSLTRAGYRAKLQRLWGFWAPLEERLAAHAVALGEVGLDFESRRRRGLMEEDLRVLGAAFPLALPSAQHLPELPSTAAALGALYVLEGATLGGQFISKRLGPSLDLSPEHGLAFFSSGGAPVGPRWNDFKRALAEHTQTRGQEDATVASAQETFRRLALWLAPD